MSVLFTFEGHVSSVQGSGNVIIEDGAPGGPGNILHDLNLRGLSVAEQRAFGAHYRGRVRVTVERIEDEP
jgi:hypothetical protein